MFHHRTTFAALLATVLLVFLPKSARAQAPTITTHPVGQAVVAGSTATFSVTATGTALAYQWLRDGLLLSGATNATLTLANVQPPRIGNYSVVITNAAGSVTSSVAQLNIPGVDPGIWQGLVAYYPFNGNANDESGRGNHGTFLAGSQLSENKFNALLSAVQIDGIDGWNKGVKITDGAVNTVTTL